MKQKVSYFTTHGVILVINNTYRGTNQQPKAAENLEKPLFIVHELFEGSCTSAYLVKIESKVDEAGDMAPHISCFTMQSENCGCASAESHFVMGTIPEFDKLSFFEMWSNT